MVQTPTIPNLPFVKIPNTILTYRGSISSDGNGLKHTFMGKVHLEWDNELIINVLDF